MARIKLDVEPDPEVNIIGISSHVKDYRLCWAINRALDLALTKRRKGISEEHDGVVAEFSAYDHMDETTETGCTLVNNHGSDGILLRELRHADYFLVVDEEWPEELGELLRKVRSAEFVLTAFPLSFPKLKEGYKLLL